MADAGEQTRDAIDTAARRWIADGQRSSILADYPKLALHADAIQARASRILEQIDPSNDQFLAAHEHLAGDLP